MPETNNANAPAVPAKKYIVEGAHYFFPEKTGDREARMYLACGEKGGGKSWETIRYLISDYVVPPPSSNQIPRKGLILDVNDEYRAFGVRAISIENIPLFCAHPQTELRCIRPYTIGPGGIAHKMSLDDILQALNKILNLYKGGVLLVEDISRIAAYNLKQDLLGAICTNRHNDCDVIMHYQNTNRPLPAVWENTNIVRLHHQKTSVYNIDPKNANVELFRIGQIIVNRRHDAGQAHFFVHLDLDSDKIYGNFSGNEFMTAIIEMISERHSHYIKPLLDKRDVGGNKMYNYATALKAISQKKFLDYWGNTVIDPKKAHLIFC